jgi:hypothetical protein
MFEYLYYILGWEETTNHIYDEYVDKDIMKVKMNLKKTIPIRKQFYCPSQQELIHEINKRNIKKIDNKQFIPKCEDLIKCKNNLKKTKNNNFIKKTFADQLKFAKLNLRKTKIDTRIENFCNTYLDKFEKDKKNINYVILI